MVLRLCIIVALFCLPTHNVFPRTSLHHLPCLGTMKKYLRPISRQLLFFLSFSRNLGSKYISAIVYNIFAYFTFSLSATQRNVVQECCRLPKSTSFMSTFHIGPMFCFSPDLSRPHKRDKNNPFLCERISISNMELYPNCVLTQLSRVAFPMKVLPKDDRTDFAQEEQLGLPYWTMILATCALVDVSNYLDTLTLKFSATMVHLPF